MLTRIFGGLYNDVLTHYAVGIRCFKWGAILSWVTVDSTNELLQLLLWSLPSDCRGLFDFGGV